MVDFSYKNEADRMVVLRCVGPSQFFLERVLFPKEIYILEAPEGSILEIWGHELFSPQLEQRFRIV